MYLSKVLGTIILAQHSEKMQRKRAGLALCRVHKRKGQHHQNAAITTLIVYWKMDETHTAIVQSSLKCGW